MDPFWNFGSICSDFPIVCVVGLAFFIWKVWTHYRDDMNANMERLQARCIEREKVLTKTIQEN